MLEELELSRYMVVQLRFDRESFTALKELLRALTVLTDKDPSARLTNEALKRVFDQIRDMEYHDE